MKPTPEQLNVLKPGASVVLRLSNGTEQSAKLTHLTNDGNRFCFQWKTGPGPNEVAGIQMGRGYLPDFVIAIFPPGVKFLVTSESPVPAEVV